MAVSPVAAVTLLLLAAAHLAASGPPLLRRTDQAAAEGNSGESGEAAATGGLGAGAIVGIVGGAAVVLAVAGLFIYHRVSASRSRPVHGGKVATVVAMRGAGALNLQGQMAVLPDDDGFHIGTQQGVLVHASTLEKPPRAARPMSWYKAREAGVSPLHIQAMARSGPAAYPVEDAEAVTLHSPSGALQTPTVGTNVATVQVSVDPAAATPGGRPLPPAPAQRRLQEQQLETPVEPPGGYLRGPPAAQASHLSEVEWDSEEDEEGTQAAAAAAASKAAATAGAMGTATLPSAAEIGGQLSRTPSAKIIADAPPPIDPSDPSVPAHPRLFMLTPGRGGAEAVRHPEDWSRTTFQLRLLCEGAAPDYANAHLTEEHGIAVRDPTAFLRHAARYVAQTADALIARDDDAFEQAEVFASSSEAGEYLELLADTLRAWYSDLLVALEEAAAEGHEVDQELLDALRAQKDDPASSAKQELGRFLAKYDPSSWYGGLRRTRVSDHGQQTVRWLCASCASKAVS